MCVWLATTARSISCRPQCALISRCNTRCADGSMFSVFYLGSKGRARAEVQWTWCLWGFRVMSVGKGVVARVGRRAWSSRGEEGGRDPRVGGSQTSPSLAHTRDEVKSSSSSVVSCHAVSIHSLVVSVCPSSQVFLVLLVLQCCVYLHRILPCVLPNNPIHNTTHGKRVEITTKPSTWGIHTYIPTLDHPPPRRTIPRLQHPSVAKAFQSSTQASCFHQ